MKAQGHITVRRRPKDGADGRGILTVTTYYLASSASSGVTTSTSGWTTAIQEVTSAKRYLWTFTRTTYTAGSTVVDTTPAIIRVFADTGLTYRTSKYTVGVTYRNDNNPYYRDANGVGYIDIVYLNEISIVPSGNPASAFICNKTHTASAATPAVGELWTAMNTQQPIYTALLLTKKIIADYIDVDTLHVKHLNGADGTFTGSLVAASGTFKGVLSVYNGDNLVAKIGDTAEYSGTIYPFWIGGATPSTAITKIDSTGKLTTTNIVATGGTIGGFSISSTGIGTLGATDIHSESSYLEKARLYLDSIDLTYGARQAILDARKRGNNLLYLQCLNYTSIGPLAYLETSGAEAIRVASGMFGGFRPYISTRVSGTLADYENVVVCNNNSAYTISLPSSPKKGQMYLIYHLTSTQITISGNGNNIRRLTASGLTTVSSTTSGSIECVMCNWDGSYWYLTYIKVS